jgi:hypothetical protein
MGLGIPVFEYALNLVVVYRKDIFRDLYRS